MANRGRQIEHGNLVEQNMVIQNDLKLKMLRFRLENLITPFLHEPYMKK